MVATATAVAEFAGGRAGVCHHRHSGVVPVPAPHRLPARRHPAAGAKRNPHRPDLLEPVRAGAGQPGPQQPVAAHRRSLAAVAAARPAHPPAAVLQPELFCLAGGGRALPPQCADFWRGLFVVHGVAQGGAGDAVKGCLA